MRSLAKAIAILVIAAATAGCGSAAATPTPAPTPVPTVAPTLAAPAAATSMPTTDGAGPEYVTGTFTFSLTTQQSVTDAGTVTQIRNIGMSGPTTTNDPRVTGTISAHTSADAYGNVGPEWGTERIENSGGAWEGNVTGAAWNDGNTSSLAGWLTGSGGYAGYTLYLRGTNINFAGTLEGIIFPGTPPNQ